MRPMKQLNAAQLSWLNKASKKAVSDIFQKNNDFKNNNWLKSTNSYLHDTINKIYQDDQSQSLNNGDLGSYIAISAPLHCVDGWTYLSRAFNSLMHGDFYTARHLGYYAELRAAISILASEGIEILSTQHFVVDKNQKCWKIPNPSSSTHAIVWPVLEYWAKQDSASKLIGSVITPYGIKLEDWHNVFASNTTFPAIAREWLVSWGLDLQQLNIDHETRNEISYRPYRVLPVVPVVPAEITNFVQEFWSLFSPSGLSKFDELDRYLLNKSLHMAHRALQGSNTLQGRQAYEDRVRIAVSNLFPDKESAVIKNYEDFLSVDKNTLVLQDAYSNDPSSHPRQAYQILSRASLLLRIATGANASLILSSGFSWSDLEFWWKGLGIDIGFWDTGNEPVAPDELWVDVENSIAEMNEWEHSTQSPTVFDLHTTSQNSKHLWMLSGTERIAMWGLLR